MQFFTICKHEKGLSELNHTKMYENLSQKGLMGVSNNKVTDLNQLKICWLSHNSVQNNSLSKDIFRAKMLFVRAC